MIDKFEIASGVDGLVEAIDKQTEIIERSRKAEIESLENLTLAIRDLVEVNKIENTRRDFWIKVNNDVNQSLLSEIKNLIDYHGKTQTEIIKKGK